MVSIQQMCVRIELQVLQRVRSCSVKVDLLYSVSCACFRQALTRLLGALEPVSVALEVPPLF